MNLLNEVNNDKIEDESLRDEYIEQNTPIVHNDRDSSSRNRRSEDRNVDTSSEQSFSGVQYQTNVCM